MAISAQIQALPPTLRLPGDVQAMRYRLDLTVAPDQEDFSGSVTIDLRVTRDTRIIWLNAAEIDVQSANLTAGGVARDVTVVPGGSDFVGLQLTDALKPGAARVDLRYRGKINSKSSEGLFRNKVGDDWYAFTQFEAVAARRAFPCFDEPSYKVPWQLTLRVKKELMALSNTRPIGETDAGNGMKAVTFAETAPLPSYLVAFAVGPFEAVEAGTAGRGKTPIRIIAPRGKAAEAKYAAESTARIVTLLEEYFGIPYPYAKLDQVAVPLFFGAMENPGLVTYADTIILASPEQDSLQRQRGYVGTAAHELAHQWFGDLVTATWWDDIWLNEAFASWMGEKITDRFRPDWNTRVAGINSKSSAMSQDSLVSARKIRQPIESKNDIANAFDGITYAKGAAVIGMFERWVGEETFRAGVREYLKKFSFANATADDFLSSIDLVSDRKVKAAFSTFLEQPGVPLVTVDVKCGGGSPRLEMSQRRSLPLGSRGSAQQTWQIPMCVSYEDGGQRRRECTLMSDAHMVWTLGQAQACPSWLLANDGEIGYYRTLYGGDLLNRLLAERGSKLTEAERVGLIQEVRDLSQSGDVRVEQALGLLPEFRDDASRFVIGNLIAIAGSANTHVPQELRPNFTRLVNRIFGPKARELGWRSKPGESEDTRLLRLSVVQFVAREGDEETLRTEARDLALRWLDDRSAVPADMASAVLRTAAAAGDRTLFDRFLAAANATTNPREGEWLFGALGSFRDPEIVQQAFGLLLRDDVDIRRTLGLLFGPTGYWRTQELPFQWLKAHYDALKTRLPRGVDSDLAAVLPFTARFCDEQSAADAEAFFKDKMANAIGGPRNLARAIESIRLCAAERKAHQAGIAEFLKSY